jgi:hypothetical protein
MCSGAGHPRSCRGSRYRTNADSDVAARHFFAERNCFGNNIGGCNRVTESNSRGISNRSKTKSNCNAGFSAS